MSTESLESSPCCSFIYNYGFLFICRREFGLERFVPVSLFEGMKRKELRRLISHFLKLNAEMTGSSSKVLTQLQVSFRICRKKMWLAEGNCKSQATAGRET